MSDKMYLVYLFVGYAIIWGGLFLYVLKLHMDQNKLKKEMKVLSEILDQDKKKK